MLYFIYIFDIKYFLSKFILKFMDLEWGIR